MDENKLEDIKLKDPKSFEDQLEILKSRNMKVEDDKKSIEVLRMANYYRITAYVLQFKNENGYIEGTSFNNMYQLYKFDKRLRHILLEILESIEISLRTYIAYHLSLKYGAEAHKNEEIFNCKEYYYTRNICAHYGRLYNKKMSITPIIHNKYKNDSLVFNRVFTTILCIKELTKNMSEWDSFKIQLETLIYEYKDVLDLELIGFPSNWSEILSRR